MVEFRLLGDVEATVGDELIDMGHARQRCVLVVLLVDANRVVSVDQLLDRVWGQQAPQKARNVLYAYVSRLRQALAVSEHVRILRQSAGYVLTVDPLAVDLYRFRHLTDRARAADTDAEALALFERALQLWRGEPFSTLDTPWLASIREDLCRRRLVVELDRNDLALSQGRHTELLAELATVAALHPLDERLAGQVMLALYRSGRRADALIHYQQLRQRLADELGTDPNLALRQMHQRILTGDPVLDGTTSTISRATSASVIPRQLPAPPGSFAGRTKELARLDALLRITTADRGRPTTMVISAVSGTPGIGKTALTLHWAHRVSDRFPDGLLYVNLRGFDPTGQAADPGAVVRGFLDALGVAPQRIPAEPDAQAALYRTLLAGRRLLVVLDNARDSSQVRPLLPGAPGCLVLVTSRNQLTGLTAADGAHPITLDLLSIDEARELLMLRLGCDRISADTVAVQEIIDRCARLPLALAIVAARAANQPRIPLRILAAQLGDARGRLDALATDDATIDVRAVFSWSYRTLTMGAARLFRLLGLHPGPDLSAPAAASLAALPFAQVQPQLAELVQANLLAEHVPGRYAFHDLLRAYAADLARAVDTDQQRHAATHRILDHYLHTAFTADQLLSPASDPITLLPPRSGTTPELLNDHHQALTWFIAEHLVLMAAIAHAATAGFDTHICQLAWTLDTFFDRHGHWHDWITAERVAVAAANRLADPTAQISAHRELGQAYIRLRRFDDAHTHLEHTLHLATRAGDLVEQAITHGRLAYLWDMQGDISQGLIHNEQALGLFQTAGHRHGQARALVGIGWCHAVLGDYRQALVTCRQAHVLLEEYDDRYGQAHNWDSMGYIHCRLGRHSDAISSFQRAIAIFRDLGGRYHEANTLIHLGDTHHAANDPHATQAVWRQALIILDELDHPDADQLRAKLADLRASRSDGRLISGRENGAVRPNQV